MPDTDLDALHIPPHLITTVTHFHKRNSAEHTASGSHSQSQPLLWLGKLSPYPVRTMINTKKNVMMVMITA